MTFNDYGFDSGANTVNTSEQKVSRFNSAELINLRMHNLWTIFHGKVLSGRLIEANWALDRVWGELSGDATKESQKTFDEFIKRFGKINESRKKEPALFFDKLYMYILDKEKFLRTLQNTQGKGTAYEETLEEYMNDEF